MSEAPTLDPEDWESARRSFHAAVDLCLDHLREIRNRPVWTPMPEAAKAAFGGAPPTTPQPLDALLGSFARDMLPYANGNLHPRFCGWVHGAGSVAGALGEMLAGFINCNAGGRDHVGLYVERQVIDWCRQIFGFPAGSSGILTTGTSMAMVIALAAARDAKAGAELRKHGLSAAARRLVGYASSEVHNAAVKAFELLGLGREALRAVPVDAGFRMETGALAEMIAADRAAGLAPFAVIGSAGTVNTGAIDDLDGIATLCAAERLWFHVDGAFGALAMLAPELRSRLVGIARADSLAFDFHKWLQVPYDAGCVLIRDAAAHRRSFATRPDYLARTERGLAGGDPWFCDYGPEMSRGFRALKVWFTIAAYGTDRLGAAIAQNCRQARELAAAVAARRELELLAPVSLNIVCFRLIATGFSESALDALNAEIVAELQLQGIAAPSTTRIRGKTAIRACLTNHRTRSEDLEILVRETCRLGRAQLARCSVAEASGAA